MEYYLCFDNNNFNLDINIPNEHWANNRLTPVNFQYNYKDITIYYPSALYYEIRKVFDYNSSHWNWSLERHIINLYEKQIVKEVNIFSSLHHSNFEYYRNILHNEIINLPEVVFKTTKIELVKLSPVRANIKNIQDYISGCDLNYTNLKNNSYLQNENIQILYNFANDYYLGSWIECKDQTIRKLNNRLRKIKTTFAEENLINLAIKMLVKKTKNIK